jgi:hypothetical protein
MLQMLFLSGEYRICAVFEHTGCTQKPTHDILRENHLPLRN